MFEKYSSEQTAHIVAFASLVSLLARAMGYEIAQNDLVALITALFGAGAIVYAYYKRYSRGDLSVGGFRK